MLESMLEKKNTKGFTICLNMIVKNESKIIVNTLTNLCEKIDFDYWVICDTGSTDNTKELIQAFFDEKNIKGELFSDDWVDFGHNRTLALERAFNKTDYLLINDADDMIVGDIIFPENIFEYDSYYLKIKLNTIVYQRIQLINNRKKYKYVGVLHEYIECLDKNNKISTIKGDYYVNAGTFGDRTNCSDKYMKDALVLENAYKIAVEKNDPLHMRYSFYCANSYRDANDINNAIKWYKNTLTLNNWNQEKYMSCLRLYELYNALNTPEPGIYYLIESHNYDAARVECILHLIKFYCIKKQDKTAFTFYTLIQSYYENDYLNDSLNNSFNNKLFVTYLDYSFFLAYYMIIITARLKKYDIGLKMYDIIFTKKCIEVDIFWIECLIYNLYFFFDKNKEESFIEKWREYFKLVKNKHQNIDMVLLDKYPFLKTIVENGLSTKINNVYTFFSKDNIINF
jgi:hypothetical protein